MHHSSRRSSQGSWKALALGVLALSTAGVNAQGGQPGRTTEAAEAAIKDPKAECEPYNYPPMTDALASFPTIWQPATIVQGDSNAQAKWDSIKGSIPDIPPKGTLQGNFDGLNYPADDPDCWWTNTKCNNPKIPGLPADIFDMPEPGTLGYGFDDGPNCSHNAFYDYLAAQNQKATMFFIGSNIMNWPLETLRALIDGHEICIHSWSHRYMTAFESPDAFAELYYKMQAVKIAAGVTPTCWRPPFGDVDDRIRAIANGLGLTTILWEYDSQDWQSGVIAGVTPETVDREYQTVIDDAKNGLFNTGGTILLAHEIDNFTMAEAVRMHPKLKTAFKYIVPVLCALNRTQPYVESNFTGPNFVQYIAGSTNVTFAANGTNLTMPSSTPSSSGGSSNTLPVSGVTPQPTQKTGDAVRLGSPMVIYGALSLFLTFAATWGFLPA